MSRRHAVVLTILVSLLASGCTGGDGREAVHGTVSLDGQPLASGLINFRPAEGHAANSSGGTIREGRFELPASQGLLPGKFLVTIQAFAPTGRMVDDPQMGRIAELEPVAFRETLPLEATIVAGRGNRLDFALTTARQPKTSP